MASVFSGVTLGTPIEVFQKKKLHDECTAPNKLNLTVGAYRTEEGKPWVLPVVREAEKALANDATLDHEYLPVLGYAPFCQAAVELLFGSDNPVVKEGKAFGVQCLSGTGSLRLGADFLHSQLGYNTVFVSDPTWGNHNSIFKAAGFTDLKKYRYWDAAAKALDINGLIQDLEGAPAKSVVILHGCAHNPTGLDPTEEQWEQISAVCAKKNIFPFMDLAYQGFASGDPDQDAWAVRHFASKGFELFCAQSYAKNMGLYNERVGNLSVLVKDPSTIAAVKSQFSLIVRANWSNPPSHGARIVHMVLTTPALRQQWFECIRAMSGRIKEMRALLKGKLEERKTPGNWDHIVTQIGMFSYTGLSPAQCQALIEKEYVFLLSSGRINICGVTTKNCDRLADAIHAVVTGKSKV